MYPQRSPRNIRFPIPAWLSPWPGQAGIILMFFACAQQQVLDLRVPPLNCCCPRLTMGAAAPVWNSMGGVNLIVWCDDSCRIARLKQLGGWKKKKKKKEDEKEQEDEDYEEEVLLRGPILREG